MADKPSRALVLYGDGLARSITPNHTHLHSFASLACCGFLALENSFPSDADDERILREFAQLIDAQEFYSHKDEEQDATYGSNHSISITGRFVGLRAAIATNNAGLQEMGKKLGYSILQQELRCHTLDAVVREWLKLLGLEQGKACETYQFDLIVVHIGDSEDEKGRTAFSGVEYLNGIVGEISKVSIPESKIASRLHLSVVISYGRIKEGDESSLSVLIEKDEDNSVLQQLFPRQSYMFKGGYLRNNIRHYSPMLFMQYQDAVTRKDMVETFSFEELKKKCCNLTIPADRFLHEVAFKLWKAPKYGA